MSWVKLDDKRAKHRKFRRLGFAARGLDEAAICHASHDETDGRITHDDLDDLAHHHGVTLDEAQQLAQQLVDVGRWQPTDDGWIIHDYLDYNPSQAQTARRLTANRRPASAGGRRSGEVRRARSTTRNPVDQVGEDRAQAREPAVGEDPEPPGEPTPTDDEAGRFKRQRSDTLQATVRTPSRPVPSPTPTPSRAAEPPTPPPQPRQTVASLTAGRQQLEADFDTAWAHYPRKVSRKAALRAYLSRRRTGATAAQLLHATRHYAAAMAGRSTDHIMHGATFYGPDDRWHDYLDPPADTSTVREPTDIGPWARRNRPPQERTL